MKRIFTAILCIVFLGCLLMAVMGANPFESMDLEETMLIYIATSLVSALLILFINRNSGNKPQ